MHGNGTNGHPAPRSLPDTWDEQQVEAILRRIEQGDSVRTACLDSTIPDRTFRMWVTENVAGLAPRYARARELQVEAWEDKILEAANDTKEDPNRSRLKVDALKWVMGKIHPRKYGDHSQQTVTVEGGKPIQIRVDPFKNHRELMAERQPIELANSDNS